MESLDFVVDRQDLRKTRFVTTPLPELAPGQVLLAIDRFAFTANNVTYAAFGAMMSYWSFFPATDATLGRVPVWGFADVQASRCDGIAVGERIYGYFPMSSHLVVQPAQVTPAGFVDATPHRAALHAVYNNYVRTAGDPGYDPRFEDQQMLLRPLFTTSFLIDDFLAEGAFFGAGAVVIASASSKTAYGLAFLLSRRTPKPVEVIGLTSPGNVAFVRGLGCYDRVVPYGEVASLPSDLPIVLVDMAGDGAVLASVHHHFGERVRYSCVVGATHWERITLANAGLPGASPTLFFAPDRIQKRGQDWGMPGLFARVGAAWQAFLEPLGCWMTVTRGTGRAAVEGVYRAMLEGRARPDVGHVLSLRATD